VPNGDAISTVGSVGSRLRRNREQGAIDCPHPSQRQRRVNIRHMIIMMRVLLADSNGIGKSTPTASHRRAAAPRDQAAG
jgi:hypothetical protein